MKYCPNCGTAVEDSAVFCTQCGNHFSATSQPTAPQQEQPVAPQQPVYTQEQPVAPQQQPVYTQEQPVAPQQQPMYTPAPQQPSYPAPQKKNKGVLIALIVVIVLLLAFGGYFAFKFFSSDSDKDDPDPVGTSGKQSVSTSAPAELDNTELNSDYRVEKTMPTETSPSETNPPETNPPVVLGYTKGSIQNGYYVNEWVGLKIPTSGTWGGLSWSVGSDDEYASYESGSTDCGLILADRYAGYQVAIGFEDLAASSLSVSESDYLDIVLDSLVSVYESSGIECSVLSSYWSYELCGNSYLTGGMSLSAGENSFVQVFLVRKLDDHMAFIAMTLPTAELADEILEDFVPAY